MTLTSLPELAIHGDDHIKVKVKFKKWKYYWKSLSDNYMVSMDDLDEFAIVGHP